MDSDVATRYIQRMWRTYMSIRMARLSAHMRSMCECTVCHDECVQMVRCQNGHGVCTGCETCITETRCPMCREQRPSVPDGAMPQMLKISKMRMRCSTCCKSVWSNECERHRAWCPEHRFMCPWNHCHQTMTSSMMIEHMSHHNACVLVRNTTDEKYHVVVTMTQGMNESFIVIIESTTIIITMGRRGAFQTAGEFFMGGQCCLNIRGYYGSSSSKPIRVIVRQLSVLNCENSNMWLEEHRCGIIPPMIASRETVISSSNAPSIVPRSILHSDTISPNNETLISTNSPHPGLAAIIKARGIRDVPIATRPFTLREVGTYVAVLHLIFSEDDEGSISDVYNE